MKKLSIIKTYAEYRNSRVVEIWQENTHLAEIYIENSKVKIDFYFLNNSEISLNLNELKEILNNVSATDF